MKYKLITNPFENESAKLAEFCEENGINYKSHEVFCEMIYADLIEFIFEDNNSFKRAKEYLCNI